MNLSVKQKLIGEIVRNMSTKELFALIAKHMIDNRLYDLKGEVQLYQGSIKIDMKYEKNEEN